MFIDAFVCIYTYMVLLQLLLLLPLLLLLVWLLQQVKGSSPSGLHSAKFEAVINKIVEIVRGMNSRETTETLRDKRPAAAAEETAAAAPAKKRHLPAAAASAAEQQQRRQQGTDEQDERQQQQEEGQEQQQHHQQPEEQQPEQQQQQQHGKGEKVLVYSEWREVLLLLRTSLHALRINSLCYYGSQHETAAIQAFCSSSSSSPQVLLCTLRKGGRGLNLTAANHVLFVEYPLNKAEEKQAIGRVYRFSQTKQTHVWRYKTLNPKP